MILILPLIFSSPSLSHDFEIVSSVPITISTPVTFMFLSFFSCLTRFRYLYIFSRSFIFPIQVIPCAISLVCRLKYPYSCFPSHFYFPLFFLFEFFPSDSKSPQLSRILLSILSDLNSAMVWMVLILPLISNSSRPISNLLGTVLRTVIVITVTFMFHSLFSSLARSYYLFIFSLSFIFPFPFFYFHFHRQNLEDGKFSFCLCLSLSLSSLFFFLFCFVFVFVLFFFVLFFLLISFWSRLPDFYVSFSRTDSGLCIHYLLIWSKLNLLRNSQRITFPTQSFLVLHSFFISLQYLLSMCFNVSFFSCYNLHLQFCCLLSIFASK